ncbi:MAG: hypothetical protein A4S14_13890 [Proteobacteria bacterium SG_bin9]|nr:MAG: hypothetical protein A4S14_13890 [Proteobacteria bacterium SG_bin9]
MPDDPNHPQNKANAVHARQQRLGAALRANLKRRKQQARGRAVDIDPAPADGQDIADKQGRDRKKP